MYTIDKDIKFVNFFIKPQHLISSVYPIDHFENLGYVLVAGANFPSSFHPLAYEALSSFQAFVIMSSQYLSSSIDELTLV